MVLLVLLASGCGAWPELDSEQRTAGLPLAITGDELDYAHPGVVRLDRRDDGMEGHCAGTLISSLHVLTVRHCFYEVDNWGRSRWTAPIDLSELEVWIYFPEPDERAIDPDTGPVAYRIVALSEPEAARNDEQDSPVVALLDRPVQHVPTHAFTACGRVSMGERIVAVGYEDSTGELGARRHAEGVVRNLALARFLVGPVLTHGGDSGSPAFADVVDEFGESHEAVVGVLYAAGGHSEYLETAAVGNFIASAMRTIPESRPIDAPAVACEEGTCWQVDRTAVIETSGCSVANSVAGESWLGFCGLLLFVVLRRARVLRRAT